MKEKNMDQDLSGMNLAELCDRLVDSTMKLLKAIEQRETDGITLRDLKKEVEAVQAAIQAKRKSGDQLHSKN